MMTEWRHRKRGTKYTILTDTATLQDSSGHGVDNMPVVVYQGEDGKVWVRSYAEFHDGRFEKIGGHG